MPRHSNDGLDDLNDEQIKDLAIQHGVGPGSTKYLRIPLSVGDRRRLIEGLRRMGAISPYATDERTAFGRNKADDEPPAEFEGVGVPSTDADEQSDIAGIVDDYDRMRQGNEEIGMFQVRLSSGNEIVIYSIVDAIPEIEAEGFTVQRIDDDTMVTVDPFDPTMSTGARQAQAAAGSRRPQERQRAPRLPRRRIGKHQQADVRSLDAQRLTTDPSTPPSMPFGYESPTVSRLPKHRRRD